MTEVCRLVPSLAPSRIGWADRNGRLARGYPESHRSAWEQMSRFRAMARRPACAWNGTCPRHSKTIERATPRCARRHGAGPGRRSSHAGRPGPARGGFRAGHSARC